MNSCKFLVYLFVHSGGTIAGYNDHSQGNLSMEEQSRASSDTPDDDPRLPRRRPERMRQSGSTSARCRDEDVPRGCLFVWQIIVRDTAMSTVAEQAPFPKQNAKRILVRDAGNSHTKGNRDGNDA